MSKLPNKAKVVIIGGGIHGLSTAWKLSETYKNPGDIVVLEKNDIVVDNQFSIIVNQGPGSYSAIRISLAIAKGIKITKKIKIYGYTNSQLLDFTLENIEILIKTSKLENKLVKPLYLG